MKAGRDRCRLCYPPEIPKPTLSDRSIVHLQELTALPKTSHRSDAPPESQESSRIHDTRLRLHVGFRIAPGASGYLLQCRAQLLIVAVVAAVDAENDEAGGQAPE